MSMQRLLTSQDRLIYEGEFYFKDYTLSEVESVQTSIQVSKIF